MPLMSVPRDSQPAPLGTPLLCVCVCVHVRVCACVCACVAETQQLASCCTARGTERSVIFFLTPLMFFLTLSQMK